MPRDYYEYDRPRSSPATLLLAVFAGIALGGALLYLINGGFFLNAPAPNNPLATPRAPEPGSPLDAEESEGNRIYKAMIASVVNVDTLQRSPFSLTSQEMQTGTGSGFAWDLEGRIVTNFHVIAPAVQSGAKLRVVFADRTFSDAIVVGVAPDVDLAVLQVTTSKDKLKPISVGTSHDLQVGQRVYAIGNPFGLSLTLTKGIISALDREIISPSDRPIGGVIQTDAPINPGNSGGPLLDKDGRLIGVNTSIATPSGGNVGIGFAVPVDTINEVVPKIIAHGRLPRTDAGLTLVNQQVLIRNGIRSGAMVAEVIPGGPAEQAGLKGLKRSRFGGFDPGDLITAIDGEKINDNRDYNRAIGKRKPGDTVSVTYERNGKVEETQLTLRGI